jgi:hypothetical protein
MTCAVSRWSCRWDLSGEDFNYSREEAKFQPKIKKKKPFSHNFMISHNLLSSVTIFWCFTIISCLPQAIDFDLATNYLSLRLQRTGTHLLSKIWRRGEEGPWYIVYQSRWLRLRNQLILLWWYEILCTYVLMYNTINVDCKPSWEF